MRFVVLDSSCFEARFNSTSNSNTEAVSKKEAFALACKKFSDSIRINPHIFRSPDIGNLSLQEAQDFAHEFSRPSYSKFVTGLNSINFSNVAQKLAVEHELTLQQAYLAIALMRQQGEESHLQLGLQFKFYSEILNNLIQIAGSEKNSFSASKPDYEDIIVSEEEDSCAITFIGAGKIHSSRLNLEQAKQAPIDYQIIIKLKINYDLEIHFEPCVIKISGENPAFSEGLSQLERDGLLSKADSESEVLFCQGSKFQIISVDDKSIPPVISLKEVLPTLKCALKYKNDLG